MWYASDDDGNHRVDESLLQYSFSLNLFFVYSYGESSTTKISSENFSVVWVAMW